MIQSIKIKLIIGLVSAVLFGLGIWLNPYTITEKSVLEKYETARYNDSTSIAKLTIELVEKDKLNYSIQQDLDICNNNTGKSQINQRQLNDENKQLKLEIKRLDEALGHYEENGLMRYFVFDKQGIFKKGCYQEVFKKPDNICK